MKGILSLIQPMNGATCLAPRQLKLMNQKEMIFWGGLISEIAGMLSCKSTSASFEEIDVAAMIVV